MFSVSDLLDPVKIKAIEKKFKKKPKKLKFNQAKAKRTIIDPRNLKIFKKIKIQRLKQDSKSLFNRKMFSKQERREYGEMIRHIKSI